MTRLAPFSFASWPTSEPTAPAAPETNTVSPGLNSADSSRPEYAVRPGMPRTPRYVDSGAAAPSTLTYRPASSTAWVRQPAWCSTWSPGFTSSTWDSTTSPTAPPDMTSPTSNGGAYDLTSRMRPRMAGSTLMIRLRTRICPSPGAGISVSTTSKLSCVGTPSGREASRISVAVVTVELLKSVEAGHAPRISPGRTG